MPIPNDTRVRELLSEAMAQTAEERQAFLDTVCGGNASLRAEVQALLLGLERAGEAAGGPTVDMPVPAVSADLPREPSSGSAAKDEGPGKIIGRYKLLQLIGEGGFGSVFMAEQEQPVRRRVALKIIKLGMDTKQVIARFEAERQALAMMDHAHIARVFDAGATNSGRPYFVMELVKGVPITEYCDSQNLSMRERLELFIPVCNAVQHAHQKGIIHRDIKPSNVMVTMADGKPVPKVIDFGIAKATNARLTVQTYFTEYRQFVGTPQYMSPEQAEMSGIDIDTRSDIYSLGVLLYELLTGTTPLDAKELRSQAYEEMRRIIREAETPRPSTKINGMGDTAATIAQHRKTEPGKLGQLLRGELDWIVMRALEKDRTRRYDTPGNLAADIQRHLDNEPVLARPPSTAYAVRKFVSKHRVGVLAGTAVLMALVVGSTLATVGLMRAKSALARSAELLIETRKQKKIADDQKKIAEEKESETERLFAQGLVSQGDTLVLAGRGFEAKQDYWEAYHKLTDLRVSPFRAEAAISSSYAASPPDLLTLSGHTQPVWSVAISPDGRSVLSGSLDKTLKLWDLITGREIRTLSGHTGRVNGVAFSPDGRTALSGSGDKTLKLWDLSTGREILTLSGHTDAVNNVAFTPDGRAALSGSGDKTLKLWNLSTGKEIRTLSGHTDRVFSVAISPDGRTALSGGLDNTLKLWDLSTGKEIRTLSEHAGPVFSAAISPDGRTALTGDVDKTLKLWDLSTGREIRTLSGHTKAVLSVAFSPDSRTVLSGSDDSTLRLWDLSTGKEIRTLAVHTAGVSSVAFSPDGRTAVSGSLDKTLKLWDLSAGKESRTLSGHTDVVSSVAFSPDGRTALSGSGDKTLKLWDLSTCKEIRTLSGQTDGVTSVAISPDGRSALSGGSKTLRLWDLRSGEQIRTLSGHTDWVLSVAISPDGRTALSGSRDSTLKLWDLSTGKEIRTLSGHTGGVSSVAISPDGRTALSGGVDNTLKLWDLSTGKEIRTLSGHTELVSSVAISPDGRTALSGSYDRTLVDDKTLKLWDLSTGREILTLSGHAGLVTSVAFSPDGRTALAGSYDATLIKLWDLSTGREIRTLSGNTEVVYSVAISPDGRTALSGGQDSTLKLWDFSRAPLYDDFGRTVPLAQAALQRDPDDAAALAVLGNWYAFRGVNHWAVELLEKARTGGAAVDPLTLARCYWELSGDVPPKSALTRQGCLAAARREFAMAVAATKDAGERIYLQSCLSAVERSAADTVELKSQS